MVTAQRSLALTVGAPAGAWSIQVGPEEVLATGGSAHPNPIAKPYRWPDTPIGVVWDPPDSTQPFQWFCGTDGRRIVRTRGPLTRPTAEWPGSPTTIIVPAGAPTEYGYVCGMSVHQFSPTKWAMAGYAERWGGGGGQPFRSLAGLLKSVDRGLSWQWLGDILRSPINYATVLSTHNMGIGTHAIRADGGSLYWVTYFREAPADGTANPLPSYLSVARAPLAAVSAWLDGGPPAVWKKWDGAAFTWDAFTGVGAPLPAPAVSGHISVTWSTYLERWLMVTDVGPAWPDVDIPLYESVDGYTWTHKAWLMQTPGRYEAKGTFVSEDGMSQDTVGQRFWVYYGASDPPMDRALDDKLCRRLVTTTR